MGFSPPGLHGLASVDRGGTVARVSVNGLWLFPSFLEQPRTLGVEMHILRGVAPHGDLDLRPGALQGPMEAPETD